MASFKKFLRSCAALVGNLLNYNTLAESVGVSIPTAKKWISFLQDMDVIYLLEPYSNNELQRLVKTPKLYFVIQVFVHILLVGLQRIRFKMERLQDISMKIML